MKKKILRVLPIFIFLISIGFHLNWLKDLSFGQVPGPVDPFLKIVQGYSINKNHFSSQSLFYQFKEIDKDYEFCIFQNDIFTINKGNELLGPFPVVLSGFIAVLLKFLEPEKLFYIFVILNFFLYFLIYRFTTKSASISILIFFGLPFFIPNSEVSEHALLIIFQVLSLGLLIDAIHEKKDYQKSIQFMTSGFLLGLGLFFRHETFIFGNLLIISMLFLKYFSRNKRIFWNFNNLFSFVAGMYLSFILFFLMNYYFYDTILGPRLTANSKGIFSDILGKLEYYKVLLWKSPPNYGFFGYSPVYFLTIALLYVFRKRLSGIDLAFLISSIGLFLIIPILAPNDGGAPWGPRYLFLAVYPMVFLTGRCLKWMQTIKNKKLYYIIIVLYISTIINSVSIERKGILSTIQVSQLQKKYISQTLIPSVDLIVFTNELVAMQTGLNYIKYPIILLTNENQINSFQKKFLSLKKLNTIALIEPKLSHINLKNFTEKEKKGLLAKEIIEQFDRIFIKSTVEELELVKIHNYRMKIN